MIKAQYVERRTGYIVYAIDREDASQKFRDAGIIPEAIKEVGTDDWYEYEIK